MITTFYISFKINTNNAPIHIILIYGEEYNGRKRVSFMNLENIITKIQASESNPKIMAAGDFNYVIEDTNQIRNKHIKNISQVTNYIRMNQYTCIRKTRLVTIELLKKH